MTRDDWQGWITGLVFGGLILVAIVVMAVDWTKV